MMPPAYTFDEKRLAALDRLNILDTPAEPGFDDIVHLATHICETPVALVSLVAGDRQWFKARVGFEPCETDLNSSVCAHALIDPELTIITDLTEDERTKDNPLVTAEPHIRFYAGAPLKIATGEVLGSLCVIDGRPRPQGLTKAQQASLWSLARQVISQLDLRHAISERDNLLKERGHAEERRNALLMLGDLLREVTTIADVTRAAAALVGQTLKSSRAAFGRLNDTQDYITIEPDWTRSGVASIAGRYRLADYGGNLRDGVLRGEILIVDDVATDPRTAPDQQAIQDNGVRAFVNVPVREHGRTVSILIVHDDQPCHWMPEVLIFLRNVADRVEVAIARLKAEENQRLLNMELDHRMKNMFAMIQAIATQTLRTVEDRGPVDSFTQRLSALSSAHDLLLKQNWSSSHINGVVAAIVASLTERNRFDISGPEVMLGSRATLSVSLLLHELATNAMKYGALSMETGRVAVDWSLDTNADEPQFSLRWTERGGPPTVEPKKKGFGSRLIRMGIIGTGAADLRYPKSGFEAEFRAPLAQIQMS